MCLPKGPRDRHLRQPCHHVADRGDGIHKDVLDLPAADLATGWPFSGGTRVMSMVCVFFLVTLAPTLSFIPMKGTQKSSRAAGGLAGHHVEDQLHRATCRSVVCDVRDTPACLIESLTTLIKVSTGRPHR